MSHAWGCGGMSHAWVTKGSLTAGVCICGKVNSVLGALPAPPPPPGFRVAALANLVLAPFLLLFLLIFFFMRNAERFYHHPGSIGSRRWSALAKWGLRELNELPHYLNHRCGCMCVGGSHTCTGAWVWRRVCVGGDVSCGLYPMGEGLAVFILGEQVLRFVS